MWKTLEVLKKKVISNDEVVLTFYIFEPVLATTVPGGRVGGLVDQLDIRLTSAKIEI